jgi:hypothetical protein
MRNGQCAGSSRASQTMAEVELGNVPASSIPFLIRNGPDDGAAEPAAAVDVPASVADVLKQLPELEQHVDLLRLRHTCVQRGAHWC